MIINRSTEYCFNSASKKKNCFFRIVSHKPFRVKEVKAHPRVLKKWKNQKYRKDLISSEEFCSMYKKEMLSRMNDFFKNFSPCFVPHKRSAINISVS